MSKRYRATDLPSDDLREWIHELLEFSEEEQNISEFSSDDDVNISVGELPGSSGVGEKNSVAFPPVYRGDSSSGDYDSNEDSDVDDDDENIVVPAPAATHTTSWSPNGQKRVRFPPKFQSGIKGDFLESITPIQIFENFFSDDICQFIAEQTNLYAQQQIGIKSNQGKIKRRSREQDWVPTNKEEIKLLFALLLLQGIIQKPTLGHYFSRNRLVATPVFFEIMTEKRFFLLLKFLHFSDNEAYDGQTPPKLYKIQPVFDHLVRKFSEAYIPADKLSIDESLLLWKGRLGWKIYIPKKRARFGMESYKLCEAQTGYVWSMLWYTGATTQLKDEVHGVDISSFTKPSKIVCTLAERLLKQGYLITMDNYYSSPELFDFLNEMETDAVGTVRSNRKGLPKEVVEKKMKKGEVAASYRKKLMALKWRDKRDICMLSSVHDAEMQTVPVRGGGTKDKPIVCVEYNDAMGGVDLSDQYVISYSTTRKRLKKYYHKIFRHLLDIAVFNSYVIYKKHGGNNTHLQFRLQLIEKLIEKYNGSTPPEAMPVLPVKNLPPTPAERFSARHFPDTFPPSGTRAHTRKRCVVCLGKKERRETMYRCNDCDVALCPAPCFRLYHTQQL